MGNKHVSLKVVSKGLAELTNEELERVISYPEPHLLTGVIKYIEERGLRSRYWPQVIGVGVANFESAANKWRRSFSDALMSLGVNPDPTIIYRAIDGNRYYCHYCDRLFHVSDQEVRNIAKCLINHRKRGTKIEPIRKGIAS